MKFLFRQAFFMQGFILLMSEVFKFCKECVKVAQR